MSERADLLSRHVSPDGELVWRVERELETDGGLVISLGFEGLPWHLHPKAFEAKGRSPEEIAADVTDDLINDRTIVLRTDWPTGYRIEILDNLEFDIDFNQLDEARTLRFWSGRRATVKQLIDGAITYQPLGVIRSLP